MTYDRACMKTVLLYNAVIGCKQPQRNPKMFKVDWQDAVWTFKSYDDAEDFCYWNGANPFTIEKMVW